MNYVIDFVFAIAAGYMFVTMAFAGLLYIDKFWEEEIGHMIPDVIMLTLFVVCGIAKVMM